MNSLDLCRVGQLVYPIMLAQEAGEMSESKAAELLGLNIESYRDEKHKAIKAIRNMLETLPCPLLLLLGDMKGKQDS